MIRRKLNNISLGDFNFDVDIEIIKSDLIHSSNIKNYFSSLMDCFFSFDLKGMSKIKNYIFESYLNNEKRKQTLLDLKRNINTKFINYMYNNETIEVSRYIAVALGSLQLDVYNNTDKPEKKPIKLISTKEIVKKEYHHNLTDLNS